MSQLDTSAVSKLVSQLKAGHTEAVRPLWEKLFGRMVKLAHRRVRSPQIDHEVVAASAFNSFCAAALKGRFPDLTDRDDLWRLLIFITHQKMVKYVRYSGAGKRRSDRIEGDADLSQVLSREPSPDFAAMLAEEVQGFLDRVGDAQLQQVALWKMEGMTHEEIAARQGCTTRTVMNRIKLIRSILNKAPSS